MHRVRSTTIALAWPVVSFDEFLLLVSRFRLAAVFASLPPPPGFELFGASPPETKGGFF